MSFMYDNNEQSRKVFVWKSIYPTEQHGLCKLHWQWFCNQNTEPLFSSFLSHYFHILLAFLHVLNWFFASGESLVVRVLVIILWDRRIIFYTGYPPTSSLWSWYQAQEVFQRAEKLSRHALNSVSVPLYLVEIQIDPLKADSSLVAHGDQHRIWILKLRTLGSLRRQIKTNQISLLIIYVLNMPTT